MRYFPIYIDLKHQPVVVIGGGESAAQKVRLLLKTDAKITVIATSFTPELLGFEQAGRISIVTRRFDRADLTSARLIYAATGDAKTDRAVSTYAQNLNTPVNVVDDQEACSFITPAIVDRAPVVIAISTEGAAPVLAREIKSKLEAMLPANFGALARFAAKLRPAIAKRIEDAKLRRSFWQSFFKGNTRDVILAGNEKTAWQGVGEEIENTLKGIGAIGKVSLVGVGCGNPDFLTLKAQQILQEADVIVLDGLVKPGILEYARRDAERLYVGKTAGQKSIRQSEINAQIARLALDGSHVLRLQGGDSLHFARAIDDLNPLSQLGIKTQIIPGVDSLLPRTVPAHAPQAYTPTVSVKG